MNREQLASKIRWNAIIWLVGLVNVIAMLPQLYRLWSTKVTEGLSSEMFIIYMLIQIAFSAEGYFKRNRMLLVCMGLSALVSLAIIILYFSYK